MQPDEAAVYVSLFSNYIDRRDETYVPETWYTHFNPSLFVTKAYKGPKKYGYGYAIIDRFKSYRYQQHPLR